MNEITYAIPQSLLQAIVNNLSAQPAGQTRQLLNALESTTVQQDQERAQQADATMRDQIRAELAAEKPAES